MNLNDLSKKAEAVKNATVSHVKNNVVAYACGAAAVASLVGGKFETKEFIGDDGHPGVEIVGWKDQMRAGSAVILGSIAAGAVFMNVLRRMNEEQKNAKAQEAARMKILKEGGR